MGKKKLFLWAVFAAAAAGGWLALAPQERGQMLAAAPPAEKASAERAARLGLPSREALGDPRGNPFAANVPPRPRAARPKAAARAAPAPPAQSVAPAVPYRVAGQVLHEGPAQVVLAKDEHVYLVREGDVLEGGYRVEAITSGGVTLVYVPLELRQQLAAPAALETAPAAIAKPAQLRWQGPERVQAGSNFDVALKITSSQAVRGSPLQLSYDAKLLEPVAVRAGDFFAGGSFTYRVNPGSIFVGAFGKGAVPADAEFLVVTFKPVQAGVTAELKLSSMVLQGAAGGALSHAPLAAFRTSITQ